MNNPHPFHSSRLYRILLFGLGLGLPHAQGGKTMLQWLQEYSPTGYFIIHDYETRSNHPGFHLQWVKDKPFPMAGTPIHETSHALDNYNSMSTVGSFSYPIGGGKTLKVIAPFTPFFSSEMAVDIPQSLRNSATSTYIMTGSNNMSVGSGLYGLFEEWSAYTTELKAISEMAPCIKAHFDTKDNWFDFVNDEYFVTPDEIEFRYFALRYIMYAKKKYPDIYTKILASKETKAIYTALVQYSDLAHKEWEAAMLAQKLDTKTENGWSDYWLFYNELQKQEYKDLEKLLIDPVQIIAQKSFGRYANPSWIFEPGVNVAFYRLGGQMIYTTKLDPKSGGYRKLWMDWQEQKNPGSYVLSIRNGHNTLSLQMNALESLAH